MPISRIAQAVSRTAGDVIYLKNPMDTLVQEARAFADAKHSGQIDRDGKPHMAHCERVASVFADEPVLAAAALLHDVLEDTDCTYLELTLRFGEDVAHIVRLLTRTDGQSFHDYLLQVVGRLQYPRYSSRIHRMACMIKISDIEDNLNRCDAKMAPKRPMYESGLNLLHTNLHEYVEHN